jgi:hypothetical protein
MMPLLLVLMLSATPQPLSLDVGASVSSNFSPEVVFAQRLGPRLTVGLSGLAAGPIRLGARLGAHFDAGLHSSLDLQAQVFVHRRFGLFEPSLGVGTTAFLEAGKGAHVFGSIGLSLRPGNLVDVFLEVAPGVLVDRFGSAPWVMVSLGLRLHFELTGSGADGANSPSTHAGSHR